MHSTLSVSNESQECLDDHDNGITRGVHLIYSEYDCAPSETDVEIIEGAKQYWWQSSKSNGKEVSLVYSEYDEPPSETSVDLSQIFNNRKIDGREVHLIYSDYDEPPSETDVEYDGRPWCSIFGNPALWKIREEGREMHLIYSDYTEPKSETIVEIENDNQSEIFDITQEISWSTDNIYSVDTRNTISSDIYTRRPPKFRTLYASDSLEFIEQNSIATEKSVISVQYLDNMEELLAFSNNSKFDSGSVNESTILEYLEAQELNTAKTDSSLVSIISTKYDTTLGNSFATDYNDSSNSG
uniref:Bm10331 n=1 Tax=Brugia malayi TaxID=6279 RepID=A0A0J9XX05_BRUMA|nr:Bm10331 [Brugia malayi]